MTVTTVRRFLKEEGLCGWELDDAAQRMTKEIQGRLSEYDRLLALEKAGVKIEPERFLECLLL